MAALYIAAGTYHFVATGMYVQIMPPWLPAHQHLVYLSGVLEVGFGFLLLLPVTRKTAAWGIILLLIAVFPANVQMLLNYQAQGHPHFWLAVARLPLQLPLIWWAWLYTKPTERRCHNP